MNTSVAKAQKAFIVAHPGIKRKGVYQVTREKNTSVMEISIFLATAQTVCTLKDVCVCVCVHNRLTSTGPIRHQHVAI